MKASCNIKRIEIENFRGIKSLSFEFDPSQPTIVIGPNNVGKTTFLDAIGLVLASGKFLRFELTDNDFWQDEQGTIAEEFEVKLTLEANAGCILPAVKGGVGDPIDVHALLVRGSRDDYSLQMGHRFQSPTKISIKVPASVAAEDMRSSQKFRNTCQKFGIWTPRIFMNPSIYGKLAHYKNC